MDPNVKNFEVELKAAEENMRQFIPEVEAVAIASV